MKKGLLLSVAALALCLVSCDKEFIANDLPDGSSASEIKFGPMLPGNMTRTSLSQSTGFPVGSVMSVSAFQYTTSGASLECDTIFKYQNITFDADSNWTYSPVKYWNIGSQYEFYGIYPSSVDYSFDFDSKLYAVNDFTVSDVTENQIDLMVSKKNTTYPFNLVTLDFNHLLSQVNFYFQTSSAYSLNDNSIDSIRIVSFDVTGIKNTASYSQDGYHTDAGQLGDVKGTWTISGTSGEYDFPEVGQGRLNGASSRVGLGTDLLMIPQNLAGVTLVLNYRVFFNDSTTMLQTKTMSLASVLGRLTTADPSSPLDYIRDWKSNYIYNYYISVNPAKRKKSMIDWDGSVNGDEVVDPKADLKGPDDNGDYWVEIITPTDTTLEKVLWKDLDGDGKEEGYLGNIDGENLNPDSLPIVTDGDPTNNPDGYDAILVYIPETDEWKQLERDPATDEVYPPVEPMSYEIEFSAEISEWIDSYNSDIVL